MRIQNKLHHYFLVIVSSLLLSQEYKVQFSQIPMGQGITEGDSVGFMSSIGGGLTNTTTSDSFLIGVGFLEASQNAFSESPTIENIIFPSVFGSSQNSELISANLYDINGIKEAELQIQIGGQLEFIHISNCLIRFIFPLFIRFRALQTVKRRSKQGMERNR